MILKSLRFQTLSQILFLLVVCLQKSDSVKLDPNGGYHLTIAVSQSTNQPSNVPEFIENIKAQLTEFSKFLFTATERRFFVNNANLILPYHWELGEYSGGERVAVIGDNYLNADVRLSKIFEAPHVNNPNECGLPGDYIELPLDFFQNVSLGYGLPSKVMLTAWARYRWGTWDEHGYPGDRRFPYFYKPSEISPWIPTGCSDVELHGEIKDFENNTCDATDEYYPPGGNCRFVPNSEQEAKSSLSYFHWLDSVTTFCNEETHDPNAPNKQNLYCDYQSISEVISNSPDGIATANSQPPDELPSFNFQISLENRKPLFYLLVDSSRFRAPVEVFDLVLNETKKLLEHENLQDIPVKAAVFPSKDPSSSNLEEIIPWGFVSNLQNELMTGMDLFRTGTKSQGIFNAAIMEIIEELISVGNPAGAVILVLKHGASSNVFDSEVYESELISRLKQAKIILHALELSGTIIDPQLHLEKISKESGGGHMAVSQTMFMSPNFIRKIATSFESPVMPDKAQETIFMGYLKHQEQFTIPLGMADFPEGTIVQFEVTTNRNTGTSTNLISLVEGKGDGTLTLSSEAFEYGDTASGTNRKVLTYDFSFPVDTLIDDFTFEHGGCADCIAWVMGTVQYPLDFILPEETINIEVTTSETDIDLAKNRPLQIFAKLTRDEAPIVGITDVRAVLHDSTRRKSSNYLLLKDDGAYSGDITSNDGIYSGSIVPEEDGSYFVTVLVTGARPEVDFLEGFTHMDSAIHRLLPVQQSPLGCASSAKSCAVTVVDRSVVKLEQFGSTVSVRNQASFLPHAARITDLDVIALDHYEVRLTWTVPAIFGSVESPELVYEIGSSTSPELLRTDSGFQRADKHSPSSRDEISYKTGDRCSVTLLMGDVGTVFFAVKLSHEPTPEDHNPPSNVEKATPVEIAVKTTTTTTTVATPSTSTRETTTTTRASSTPTGETSTETSTSQEELKTKYWYETTEGTITLGVFGAGVVILIVGFLIFKGFTIRRNTPAQNKSRQESAP